MDTATVSSTFVLTLLLLLGLVFFIRASTKDRTESVRLASDASVESLHQQLKDYFDSRAYRVKGFEGEEGLVTWEGMVQASLGLAVFLAFLAFLGLLCLALVLGVILPQVGRLGVVVVGLAPLAGWFYWRRAARLETVSYRVYPRDGGSQLAIAAHRDEIIVLRQQLSLQD